MNFLFVIFIFIAIASGIGGLSVVLYRQILIRKLKGKSAVSFFERLKEIYFYIKKYIININSNFVRNNFYKQIENSLKIINYDSKINKEQFLFFQEINSILFFILSLFILNDFLFAICFCVVGFYFPVIILKFKVDNKKEQILKEIPDALDIIAANIEGGLSINQAITRYASRNKNFFSEEILLVLKKVQLGKSFEEGLRELDEKLMMREISSIINSLIQAGKIGGNIKKIIKDQAEEIRKKRFQFLKKKAYEAPVKLLIPLILFIFPVIFIVLFGPIIIKILNGF
ncbi:MAG: type II secretion system F family protein [Candidatus Goldbacteria bacterium]|nr:type II secretion system F family protein [Candidatus Goldiibacteriota bacterium]